MPALSAAELAAALDYVAATPAVREVILTGGDPLVLSTRRIAALMARLAELVRGRGRSVVTVVHEVNYAAAWADHVVAMKGGRIVAEGPPETVLTEPVLSALYDTPVEVARHDDRPLVLHHHWHDQQIVHPRFQ